MRGVSDGEALCGADRLAGDQGGAVQGDAGELAAVGGIGAVAAEGEVPVASNSFSSEDI